MGKKYVCIKCGCLEFEVLTNVYSKRVVKEDHIEVVCKECNFGRIFKEIKTPNLLLTSTSSRKNEIQF